MADLMSQKNGDVLIVYFTDARMVDQSKIEGVGKELMEFAGKCEGGKLLLNFEGVRFMGSAMLGKLVALNKKCSADNCALKLCSISADIMEVFKLTRLDKVLKIYSDEPKALSAFERKGWFG